MFEERIKGENIRFEAKSRIYNTAIIHFTIPTAETKLTKNNFSTEEKQ